MSIDAGTKRRLILGLISNWISKLAGSVIQLAQVPVCLHYWSVPVYGEWLAVTAIPSYLSFSNIGFGSVAGNEMTMAMGRDDRDTALRAFQSCWWLIVIVMCITGGVVAVALYIIPIDRIGHIHYISGTDAKWIIGYLGFSVLLGQLEQLLQSAYRCVGRYAYGGFVKSMITLGAFAALLIPIFRGHGPRTAALWFAGANVAGTVLLAFMARRDIPWLRYGWHYASFAEIRKMTPLAFAFMGFPMGNALNISGTLLAVELAMGPVAGVVFNTARTVSRVALQMVQMVNSSFEPEFSRSFAQSDSKLIRTLHRRACQMALILAGGIITAMVLGGPWLLNHWTQGKVPPSRPLLSVLLVVVLFYALWSTSSTILYATNKHQKLAAVYLGATSTTVALTYLVAGRYGLMGAAWSLVLSEILMNVYVLPASLRLAQDTFPAFMGSMLDVPPAFHPRNLLRRLSRSKPGLES